MSATTDPLFAVGVYFLGVHAYRHSRRLACTRAIMSSPSEAAPPASLLRRLLRVHAISLPLMWPTAIALAGLCWALGGVDTRTIADASIAFYMITTLPHHLLGLRLPPPHLRPAT